jgi:hypothetical protein
MSSLSPLSEYLSMIGLPALVGAGFGAGVTAFLSHFSALRVIRRQNEIKQVEEKLALYSLINFYFDRMRFKYEAIREHDGKPIDKERFAYSATKNEMEHIISQINQIIGEKYYLFKQDILKEWVYITTFYSDATVIDRMPKLRQMIIKEYNTRIIQEYERLTETKIDEIS